MIRGAVYRVDLGPARGHAPRGKRLGIVVSPSDMAWSVTTIIPTSTSAQDAVFRPRLEIAGRETLVLCDQVRTIDTDYAVGDPAAFLNRDAMAEVESALARYLGLVPGLPK